MFLKTTFFLSLTLFVFSFSQQASAQEILLDREVEDSITIPDKGPNSRKFNHPFIEFNTSMPFNGSGIDLKIPSSFGKEIGIRHKQKLTNSLSCGYSASYSSNDMYLKPDSSRSFPVKGNFKHEILRTNSLNLELYQRISYGLRGNYMGIFTDIGMKGGWIYNTKYITKERGNQLNSKFIRTTYNQPEITHNYQYSLFFRFGVNNLMLSVEYRLSNLIDNQYFSEDIQSLMIGIQFGLHK